MIENSSIKEKRATKWNMCHAKISFRESKDKIVIVKEFED